MNFNLDLSMHLFPNSFLMYYSHMLVYCIICLGFILTVFGDLLRFVYCLFYVHFTPLVSHLFKEGLFEGHFILIVCICLFHYVSNNIVRCFAFVHCILFIYTQFTARDVLFH